MVSPLRRARGFGLIETMVVLTLMLLIAVAASPFAVSWGNQAAVRQTQSLLVQAMALTKSTALKNPLARSSNEPAATLISSASAGLCVHAGSPAVANCNGALWRATPGASIQLQGANTQCIALANDGRPLAASVGALSCQTSLSYQISRGNENSQATLN